MERTRVIIADDESLIRMDLREMLTNLGYLVVGEASDGLALLALAYLAGLTALGLRLATAFIVGHRGVIACGCL